MFCCKKIVMEKEIRKTDVKIVLVTAPEGDSTVELAKRLVEVRKAACVNIIPGVRSIYSWEGEVCDDKEVLLVIKTLSGEVEGLKNEVLEHHPYDVPEFLVLPLVGGHHPYLDWVRGALGEEEKKGRD